MSHFTTRYTHEGIALNVSGTRDEDSCEIERITVDGNAQNLIELFAVKTLCTMAEMVDAQLSREARRFNAEARAERNWSSIYPAY
jgi:hypothetical protein